MLMYIYKQSYWHVWPHSSPPWQNELVKGKCGITLPCQILSTFSILCVCVCVAQSITSHLSSNPSPFRTPSPPPPSLTLLGSVQKPRHFSDVCTRLPIAQPNRWCVSCQSRSDGCIVETYLEFELCPSRRSPLAPRFDPATRQAP